MINPNQITCSSQGTLFGTMNRCRVEFRNGALAIFTPYSAQFVRDLKFRISAENRAWEPNSKCWLAAFTQSNLVAELIKEHYGETVEMPVFENAQKQEVSGVYRVEYIGRTKPRGDGNYAFGFANNNWGFIFPEKVLKNWFDKFEESKPEEKTEKPKTFYQILRAKRDALPVDIKKAYYRMARMWHPDVCREEDARERFEQIKAAYDVLSDIKKRRRYDLGLKLQKQAVQTFRSPNKNNHSNFGYSPDLRCGLINLRGAVTLGKITVEEIFDWRDIEDENGNFLVSSWNLGLNAVELTWINRNVIF